MREGVILSATGDTMQCVKTPDQKTPNRHEVLTSEIEKIVKDIYYKERHNLAHELFVVGQGAYPYSNNRAFDLVSGEVGSKFDAHGIIKTNQLQNLLNILKNGVDQSKPFHTAPFEISKEHKSGMAAALGTTGGVAYKDGMAVLTSGYNKMILEDGVEHVFINDIYTDLVKPMQKLFPQYKFHLLSEQKTIMENEANNP